MWETIKTVLISQNAWLVLLLILILVVMGVILVKKGILAIDTKHFRMGQAEKERELIRRQIERSHEFVMSIEGKLKSHTTKYDGYFTKYLLERIYDKVIEWIMFNHISNSQMYVQDKQETICNLIYTYPVAEEYKTPEFKERVCKWTQELIQQLVQVRDLYFDCHHRKDE